VGSITSGQGGVSGGGSLAMCRGKWSMLLSQGATQPLTRTSGGETIVGGGGGGGLLR
jgi:hypothetical protein